MCDAGLAGGPGIRFRSRFGRGHGGIFRLLDEAFPAGSEVARLVVEAGWYAVLRIPATVKDEETVFGLLTRAWGCRPQRRFLWVWRLGMAGGEPA